MKYKNRNGKTSARALAAMGAALFVVATIAGCSRPPQIQGNFDAASQSSFSAWSLD